MAMENNNEVRRSWWHPYKMNSIVSLVKQKSLQLGIKPSPILTSDLHLLFDDSTLTKSWQLNRYQITDCKLKQSCHILHHPESRPTLEVQEIATIRTGGAVNHHKYISIILKDDKKGWSCWCNDFHMIYVQIIKECDSTVSWKNLIMP